MKITIDQALSEYTTKELVDFHANLNALFLCVEENFNILPLLLKVQNELKKRPIAAIYFE